MSRLSQQPGERIDRTKKISFTFDGKKVQAYEGDTIGSALYAAGRRTFSRSFKYHRRRGLMCVAGQCPNCICAVDGAPGARACTEPVREGITVTHVNALPSLEFDAMRATDIFGGPFTPPGFYYKTFIRPRRLWPLYEKILRNAAGLGKLRHSQPEREWRTEYRRRHADVLVTGGGIAGLNAALAAARLGADVVLADEGAEPGGQQLIESDGQGLGALIADVREAGVEIIHQGSALGYFDGLVPVWQRDILHQVRAAHHVFATGAIEQPLVFAGNDLPGVMLSGGARRLAALYGVSPGRRAVIATTSDRGLHAAQALARRGCPDRGRRRPAPRGRQARSGAARRRDPRVQRPHDHRGPRRARPSPRRSSSRSAAAPSTRSSATWSSSRAAPSPPPRCCCRPAPGAPMTPGAATSRSPSCPRACSPPARSREPTPTPRPPPRGSWPGWRPPTPWVSATTPRPQRGDAAQEAAGRAARRPTSPSPPR